MIDGAKDRLALDSHNTGESLNYGIPPCESRASKFVSAAKKGAYLSVRLTLKWMLLIIGPVVVLGYALLFGLETFLILHNRRPNVFEDLDVQLQHIRIIFGLFGGFIVTLTWAAIIGAVIGVFWRRSRAADV